MKKIFLAAILAMTALSASAETNVNLIFSPQFDSKFGVRVGADFDIRLGQSKFSFVPGFYWSLRVNSSAPSISYDGHVEQYAKSYDTSNWISVPLRFAFNIKPGSEKLQTQLFLGPYVAVGLGGTTTVKDPDTGEVISKADSFSKDGYYDRRFDAGLNLGANFIIKKHFVLGVWGEFGFVSLGNDLSHSFPGIFTAVYTFNVGGGLNLGYRF